MAGIGEFFQRLIGGAPATTEIPAAPLSSYPTPEDAMYARKYDFGYGTGNEPYTQGNVARVVGTHRRDGKNFIPMSAEGMSTGEATALALDDRGSRNIDLKTPDTYPVGDQLGTTLAQAALAANRVPVAAYGFDPSRAAFDTQFTDPNMAGIYSRNKDTMYINANAPDPSAIVHESTHRGLNKLRQDPAVARILESLPDEETLVRYIMASQAGDPEKGGGPIDVEQRDAAMKRFGNGKNYGLFMDRLNRAAEDAIASRRPGGPR
jgi:hypothetical protein